MDALKQIALREIDLCIQIGVDEGFGVGYFHEMKALRHQVVQAASVDEALTAFRDAVGDEAYNRILAKEFLKRFK